MVCLMYDVWLVFVWRTVPYDNDDDDDDNDNIHKKNRDIFSLLKTEENEKCIKFFHLL